MNSLKYVPTAVLSRQTAGLRGRSLIVNLPGKPKSIRETFDEVGRAAGPCVLAGAHACAACATSGLPVPVLVC